MSPLGRVFIVLNLALAGGFAVFAGTHLQKQHSWKTKAQEAETKREEEVTALNNQINTLQGERNTFENASTANQTQLLEARNQIDRLTDDNKRLTALTGAQAADIKKLLTLGESANSDSKAAFEQAKAAYDASIAAAAEKDSAVNEKNDALAENRNLKAQIATLQETISSKDTQIAALTRDNSEKDLLVQAATVNGFLPGMAAPSLSGTVTNVSGRLCTISISDNPGEVDIADQIKRRPFRIAIHDASGYKGDAVATKFEASANAVLCNILVTNGSREIRVGDAASTNP